MILTLTRQRQPAESSIATRVGLRALVALSSALLGVSIGMQTGGGIVSAFADWTATWLNIRVGQQVTIAIPAVLAGAIAAAMPARRSDRLGRRSATSRRSAPTS